MDQSKEASIVQGYRGLHAINKMIAGALDYNTMLAAITEQAARLVSGNAAVLLLLDGSGLLRLAAAHNIPTRDIGSVKIQIGPGMMDAIRGLSPSPGLNTFFGVPLMLRGETIGILGVYRQGDESTIARDEEMLSALADQAAIAVENARLYQQARESEARANAIIRYAPAGIYEVDYRVLRPISVNEATCRLTGYSREELLAMNPGDMLNINSRKLFTERIERLLAGERVDEALEFKIRKKDGALIDVALNVALLQDKPYTALVIGHDVTERKRAEAERERLLMEVQRRAGELEAIITSIAEGVILYSASGEIVLMNPVAKRMLEYPGEVRERSIEGQHATLRPVNQQGQPVPVEQTPAYRALRGETVSGVVLGFEINGKRLWVTASAAPVRNDEGAPLGAIGTLTDITAQQRLSEMRDDFLRCVSHDLRTPLTVVQGQAQLLIRALQKAGINSRFLQSAEAIVSAARRMNATVRDLLEAVQLESNELVMDLQPIRLGPFLKEVLQSNSGAMDTDRVELQIPPDLPAVNADPQRLQRIFANLLSNALKYSALDTPVLVKAAAGKGEITVSVVDQGVGIAPDELPRLFERFYRTGNAQKMEGLGIGLYITRLFVQAHGGQIWAESEAGKGSSFNFTLPVATESNSSLSS